MARPSRPAGKRRELSTFPPKSEALHFGSVDGKRYAGTVPGPERVFDEESEPLDDERGAREWE